MAGGGDVVVDCCARDIKEREEREEEREEEEKEGLAGWTGLSEVWIYEGRCFKGKGPLGERARALHGQTVAREEACQVYLEMMEAR